MKLLQVDGGHGTIEMKGVKNLGTKDMNMDMGMATLQTARLLARDLETIMRWRGYS